MVPWQETAGAIGTCVTAFTVAIAFAALLYQRSSARADSEAQTEQLRIQTQASQAQVYQSLLDKAERVGLTQALETVRKLRYQDYDDFRASTSDGEKAQVVVVAEFFNDVYRLWGAGMLDYGLVTGLWTLSILSCADNLWIRGSWQNKPEAWWLDGFREERSNDLEYDMSKSFYLGFQQICTQVKQEYGLPKTDPGDLIPPAATSPAATSPAATSPAATSPAATSPRITPPPTPD